MRKRWWRRQIACERAGEHSAPSFKPSRQKVEIGSDVAFSAVSAVNFECGFKIPHTLTPVSCRVAALERAQLIFFLLFAVHNFRDWKIRADKRSPAIDRTVHATYIHVHAVGEIANFNVPTANCGLVPLLYTYMYVTIRT